MTESEIIRVADALAAITGVLYVLLAAREKRLCWLFGFVSTAIYTVLFWQVSLPMQSLLNGYYMLMAGYGWWAWKAESSSADSLAIQRWPLKFHIVASIILLVVSALSILLLKEQFSNELLWLDASITWGSVFATFLLARKVLETWYYWLVFDALALVLYISIELWFTVGLFVVYLIMAFYGLNRWQTSYRKQSGNQAHHV